MKEYEEPVNDVELSEDQMELLYDVIDVYNSSTPVSGSWNTETEHEQKAIANALDVSLEDAKSIMIDYLGFKEDQF